ncbi:MAG: ATP-binding cassette domain-containing protein, partial [Actinomycetia bacterium]|nr:ATP-binding cassette domain-containing protein [Actinomycetes bacterium]
MDKPGQMPLQDKVHDLLETLQISSHPQLPHNTDHSQEPSHHHHLHAAASRHSHGHHLLQVEDLSISFSMYDSTAEHYLLARHRQSQVIHNLHISVHTGEIVAIVGASGSGKTLLADAIMGLFAANATLSGRIWFDGVEQDADSLHALRGHGISLVPQSVSCLDPLMRVGLQVQGFASGRQRQQRSRWRLERQQRQAELFDRYGLDEG